MKGEQIVIKQLLPAPNNLLAIWLDGNEELSDKVHYLAVVDVLEDGEFSHSEIKQVVFEVYDDKGTGGFEIEDATNYLGCRFK